MELEQKFYKDEDGREIEASQVTSVGIIKYGIDGFYTWQCMKCMDNDKIHGSRSCGWPIAGQVRECSDCGSKCLLLRTDTDYITELCQQKWKAVERDKELERLQGIETINNKMIREINMKFHSAIQETLRVVTDKEIYRNYK